MKKWMFIVLFLLFGASVPCAFSADIVVKADQAVQTHLLDTAHIEIVGEIISGDLTRLQIAIAEYKNKFGKNLNPLVLLNSPGGNVSEALKMGRLLRTIMAVTIVDGDMQCNSSCVFLLSGGVQRIVFSNGLIGLHRPRFEYEHFGNLQPDAAKNEYAALVQRCTDYMEEMGIPSGVFEKMLKTPSQDINFIDQEVADAMGLLGNDPAWEEWERARQVNSKGLEAVQAMDRLISCYSKGSDYSVCDSKYKSEIGTETPGH